MFYPAYIHTDRDGRASGFSQMCRGVLMLVCSNLTAEQSASISRSPAVY
jgi:hypothetical protein